MEIVKKAVAMVAIILMILASSITIAVSEQKGKVATDTLRLRKEASLESTVLELLYKDDEVEIVGEEGDWYKVKFKTFTGYVSKEYVKKESSNTPTSSTNEEKNKNNNESKPAEEENKNNENKTTVEKNNNGEQPKTNPTVENNNKVETSNTKNAVVNTDLDVHVLPLVNSNVIGKFKSNTKIEIVSVTGVWAYVKNSEIAGWIRLDKISITENNNSQTTNTENNNTNTTKPENETTNNDANKTTTESSTKMYSSPKTYYVQSSAVNVREKATTESSVVTTVSQNTEIKAVGEDGNWYKVEVSGKTGYMMKSLLGTSKVEVTTRSTAQERTEANNNTETTKKEDTKKQENTSKTTSSSATSTSTSNSSSTSSTASTTSTTNSSATSNASSSSSSSSSKGDEIVAYAKKYLGCRYVYGGSGPSVFDCSGFTMYVYKHFGYSLPHNAVTQANKGKYVAKSDLQPGDLIIFNNSANTSIGHVGMYVGGGNFIHASSGSGKIIISPLSGAYYKARYVTARRLI